jgi:hypothetical protein
LANFHSLAMDHRHWRILDAINAAPTGEISLANIQKHYGPAAMMETLEQLYDAGWIDNVWVPVAQGKAPQRRPHQFRLTADGQNKYNQQRKNAPEATDAPIHEEPADDSPKRGRPQGAKNRPKAEETAAS